MHAEALQARRLFEVETAFNAKQLKVRVGRALNAWSAATSLQVVETPLPEAARLARERKPHRAARAAQARAGSSVLEAPHEAQGGEVRTHELGESTSRDPARETREDSQATVHRARQSAVIDVTPFRHQGSQEDEGGPAFEGHAPSVVTTVKPGVTVEGMPDAAGSGSRAEGQRGRPQVPEIPQAAETGPSADAEAGTAALLRRRPVGPISTATTAVSGEPDDPESPTGAPQGPVSGTEASNKGAAVQTRWGAIRVDDAKPVMAHIKLQLDGVIAGLRAIKDPDARWQAIEALRQPNAAVAAVAATVAPEDVVVLRAALHVHSEAASASADDLVDAIVRRVGKTSGATVATSGVVEPTPDLPEERAGIEAGSSAAERAEGDVRGIGGPSADDVPERPSTFGGASITSVPVIPEPAAFAVPPVLRRDETAPRRDDAEAMKGGPTASDGAIADRHVVGSEASGRSASEDGVDSPTREAQPRPSGDANGARKSVDDERRRLVAAYAAVLIGRGAWSSKQTDRLAALIHVPRRDLWALALEECQTRYGHRSPTKIDAGSLRTLRREVMTRAKDAGFDELLSLLQLFTRPPSGMDKGLGR